MHRIFTRIGTRRRIWYRGKGHFARQGLAIRHISSIGSDQAHRTLCNAALFFGSGSAWRSIDPAQPRYPTRVVGNGLRELDRFLSILLDEVAREAGWSTADLLVLARVRNTPNKLAAVSVRLNREAGYAAHLRALGRCRDTLFHCGGVVRRGDRRHLTTLTLGWPDAAGGAVPRVLRLGERMPLDPADLAWICAFYIRIGNSLVRAC